jgi:hypothetical protein
MLYSCQQQALKKSDAAIELALNFPQHFLATMPIYYHR